MGLSVSEAMSGLRVLDVSQQKNRLGSEAHEALRRMLCRPRWNSRWNLTAGSGGSRLSAMRGTRMENSTAP
jgi:hypothetical protein